MEKLMLVVVLVSALTTSYVQAKIPFKFGAQAGFNLTKIRHSELYFGVKQVDMVYKYLPGAQIGLVCEYAINDVVAVQSSILFTTQGGQTESSILWEDTVTGLLVDNGSKQTDTHELNYIQLPVNTVYKLDIGGTKLLFQAGPYLGYALNGKRRCYEPYRYENAIRLGNYDSIDAVKRFDFGVGLGAGLQFIDIMQIGLLCNIGFANLSNSKNGFWKNSGLAITLTCLL